MVQTHNLFHIKKPSLNEMIDVKSFSYSFLPSFVLCRVLGHVDVAVWNMDPLVVGRGLRSCST